MTHVRKWALPVVIGLLSALAGVVAITLVKHAYYDHLALHELAVIEMQRQAPQQAK